MTHPTIRFCLVLHNHQPIGNFDSVFEQAYQDSYLPFLNVFEQYPDDLRISLHTSGPLMEWLDEHHPNTWTAWRGWLPTVGLRFWADRITRRF